MAQAPDRIGHGWPLVTPFLVGALLIAGGPSLPRDSVPFNNPDTSRFVGSDQCAGCHQTSHTLWSTSRHGSTVRPFTPEFARTFLPTGPVEQNVAPGIRVRLDLDRSLNEITDSSGTLRFRVSHAVGGKHVYYFLTPMRSGKLQTLPLGFDIRRQEWFSVPESGVRTIPGFPPDSPLSWTHRTYTFNSSCYRCHVSQVESTYDVQNDSYSFSWKEPGISCETCHGPSGDHVTVFSTRRDSAPIHDPKVIRTKAFTVEQSNGLCASCHAKSIPLAREFRPGQTFSDAFDIVLFEHPDYYPDGQDLGENYTYTSWLRSSCVRTGRLECLHCHTSSGRFRFEEKPDDSCLPCHAENVRQRRRHSRHEGVTCIQCHMPMTEFARMTRSDHSMLPPRPASTVAFGAPNACTDCHSDRSPSWADRTIRGWSGGTYQDRYVAAGRLIQEARSGVWDQFPEMEQYLRPGVGREDLTAASLLRLMRSNPDPRVIGVATKLLRDPSPHVRSAAAECLEGREGRVVVEELTNAMNDTARVVRVRAAASLAGVPRPDRRSDNHLEESRATREYLESLRSRPDDASSHFNLGNFYAAKSDHRMAIESYGRAIGLDSTYLPSRVNLAFAFRAVGDNGGAERNFRSAVSLDSSNAIARYNLGLYLATEGRREEGERELRASLTIDSSVAPAWFALAALHEEESTLAAVYFERAVRHAPENPKYRYEFASHLDRSGRADEAIVHLRRLTALDPPYLDACALLGRVLADRGQTKEAGEVYSSVLRRNDLSPQVRSFFERKLRDMDPRR